MDVYPTSDLSLSTVLLHHEGIRFVGIDRSSDVKRARFVFESSERLRDIVEAYFLDTLLLKPQGLLATHRKAKNLLYDFNTPTFTVSSDA